MNDFSLKVVAEQGGTALHDGAAGIVRGGGDFQRFDAGWGYQNKIGEGAAGIDAESDHGIYCREEKPLCGRGAGRKQAACLPFGSFWSAGKLPIMQRILYGNRFDNATVIKKRGVRQFAALSNRK